MPLLIGFFCLLGIIIGVQADTIDNYVNISNNIPQMEMKADPEAHAWARSARNVLGIADESILETLLQANELAKAQGLKPFFCVPKSKRLDVKALNQIILDTYRDISSQQSDKDKMTVSEVAWIGITKKFPCKKEAVAQEDVFLKTLKKLTQQ